MAISFNGPKPKRDVLGYINLSIPGPAPAAAAPYTSNMRFFPQKKRAIEPDPVLQPLTLKVANQPQIPPGLSLLTSFTPRVRPTLANFVAPNTLAATLAPNLIPLPLAYQSQYASAPKRGAKALPGLFMAPNVLVNGYPAPPGPGTGTIPHDVGFLVNVGFLMLRR